MPADLLKLTKGSNDRDLIGDLEPLVQKEGRTGNPGRGGYVKRKQQKQKKAKKHTQDRTRKERRAGPKKAPHKQPAERPGAAERVENRFKEEKRIHDQDILHIGTQICSR